jgi:ATP-binding cassette subfamily C protein CydD
VRAAGADLIPACRLWRDHPGAVRLLYAATAASLAATACWLAIAVVMASAVSRVFVDGGEFSDITDDLLLMGGLAILRAGLVAASSVLALESALAVKTSLRRKFTTAVAERGVLYVRGERAGELVQAGGQGVESLDAYVRLYLPVRWLALLAPLLVAVVVLVIDPLTLPILFFAGPVLVLLLALIGQRTRELTRRRERELSWVSAHFLDVLQGLTTLKLFGRSREQAATIEAVSRSYSDLTMDVLRTAFQTSLVLEWGAMAATALVAVAVSVRLMAGSLPFEAALAVLILTPEFFLPLRELAAHYHAGATGKEALDRLYAVLPSKEPPLPGLPSLPPPSVRRRVDLEAVSYRYDGAERSALDAVSLHLERGQLTVLRGMTGSGKTTVATLLLRFAEPCVGRILADGAPIAGSSTQAWRRQVGYVPQHPHLFNGTIADNLRLGRPDATMEELVEAATLAAVHGFISRLPRGYETQAGERGARLSGGQLQRIAIARALLKEAPLLILDEATSHLDDATEAQVLSAIDSLKHDRILLLISHAAAALRWADVVITLEGGRIVEQPARRVAV